MNEEDAEEEADEPSCPLLLLSSGGMRIVTCALDETSNGPSLLSDRSLPEHSTPPYAARIIRVAFI